MASKLTPKQEAFCKAYIETGNASEAYRRSYNVGKMKSETIARNAHALLQDSKITARVEELQATHQKRHEVTIDRVVQEFAKIGFSNAGDFFKWGPDGIVVKSSEDLTEEQRSIVAEVAETKTKDGGTIRVKLQCKQVALEKLGRHLGMFKDRVEHTGKDGGPIETAAIDLSETERARRIAFLLTKAGKSEPVAA